MHYNNPIYIDTPQNQQTPDLDLLQAKKEPELISVSGGFPFFCFLQRRRKSAESEAYLSLPRVETDLVENIPDEDAEGGQVSQQINLLTL